METTKRLTLVSSEELHLPNVKKPSSFLDKIAQDPELAEWLLYLFRHYKNWADEIIHDVLQVQVHDEVQYLIDNDVLRNFFEVNLTQGADRIQKTERVYVDSLFYNSDIAYGIPVGAFQEFCAWIRRFSLSSLNLNHVDIEKLDVSKSLEVIAKSLGIQSHQTSDDSIVAAISNNLDGNALILSRIHWVFTNPRFLGVISDYDDGDREQLEEMLSKVPRSRRGRREMVDYRDAINLAIAIKSARESRINRNKSDRTSKSFGWILLSQTSAVLKLVERLKEDVDEGDDYVAELSQMLRTEGPLDSSRFPCMRPKNAIALEYFGAFTDDLYDDDTLSDMANRFHIMTNFLERWLIKQRLHNNKVDFGTKVLESFSKEDKERVENTFKEIADSQLRVDRDKLLDIEELRVTELSIELNQKQMLDRPLIYEDTIKRKTISYLELLDEVLRQVGSNVEFSYVVEEKHGNIKNLAYQINVVQKISAMNRKDEVVITGNMFKLFPNPKKCDFFEIRWVTAVDVDNFLYVMQKILSENSAQSTSTGERDFSLEQIDENSKYWEEGIVIYTHSGVLGGPLSPIVLNEHWDKLALTSIQGEINRIYGDRIASEVMQYRLNTHLGDFAFDIVNIDGENRRYVTILSTYNLGKQIAAVYEATGMFLSSPFQLGSTLYSYFSLLKMRSFA